MPVHNEGPRIRDTIASLLDAADRPAEIIVVDDGSTDGCCSGLDAGFPDATVCVVRQARRGVAAARNAGLALAREPVLVTLDAHCAVDRDWLTPLLAELGTRPDAVVGPAMHDLSDRADVGCGAVVVDARLRYRWRTVASDRSSEVGLVPGGCMALTRDLWARLGPFDALHHYGLEDVEFCFTAWRLGIPVVGVPSSHVAHLFRSRLPYPVDAGAAAYNLVRVALIHLSGERRNASLDAAAALPRAAQQMAAALASDWECRRAALDRRSVRPIEGFFDTFAR